MHAPVCTPVVNICVFDHINPGSNLVNQSTLSFTHNRPRNVISFAYKGWPIHTLSARVR